MPKTTHVAQARKLSPSANSRFATMPKPVHIFIDLDGVLADFDAHAAREGKYDENKKVKWSELDYAWWSGMPVCDGARAFYDAAQKLGITKFLTAPVLSEDCYAGKAAWVQSFVPERGKNILKDLIICPGADKGYLAAADRILIDDREKNVREWGEAGGIDIHHKGDFSATLQELRKAVAKLAAPKPRAPKGKRAPRL